LLEKKKKEKSRCTNAIDLITGAHRACTQLPFSKANNGQWDAKCKVQSANCKDKSSKIKNKR